jgi:hypothetical protein
MQTVHGQPGKDGQHPYIFIKLYYFKQLTIFHGAAKCCKYVHA